MSTSLNSQNPNAEDATTDVSGAVSNDEETRLDAPLPPSVENINDPAYNLGTKPVEVTKTDDGS